MTYREQGPCPVKPVFYILNMDRQDGQDKQDETLRHGKLTRSVIGCVSEVIHEPGSGLGGICVET